MNEIYNEYDAPDVEILYVSVEIGFAASDDDGGGVSAPAWGII